MKWETTLAWMAEFCLFSSSEGLGYVTTGSSANDMAAQEGEAGMPHRPSVWTTSIQGVEESSRTCSTAGHRQRVASTLPLGQGNVGVIVPTLQMWKLRPREVISILPNCSAESREQEPGSRPTPPSPFFPCPPRPSEHLKTFFQSLSCTHQQLSSTAA